jgi:GAF domain-containing protein/HAMP domain-containing protein
MQSADTRWHQPTFGQSIRTRLLALFSGLIVISVLAIGYLGVNSVQTVGESAQRISTQALRTQAEEYLRRVTAGDSQRHDLILREVQRNAENVARYASGIFAQPEAFASEAYWQTSDHMSIGPDGQYANDETDVSSVFVPNFVDIDQDLLTDLELGAYLEFALIPTHDSDPNTVAIYLGTENETTRYYPNVNLGTILSPDFQVTQRPWYVNAAPANNPERVVVWSPVYIDATGQGLMVTAAAPVYTDRDEFIGVIGLDVTLKDISASVEANRLLGSGYSFLVGSARQAIALPEQGYQDLLGRLPQADEFGPDLNAVKMEWDPVLDSMMVGSTGFDTLETGGRELFVAYAPLESTGWSLANVVEVDDVLQAMATLQEDLDTSVRSLTLLRILPVGGAIFVVMAAVGLLLTDRLAAPVRRMAAAAQRIGSGQWDVPLPEARNDEIGVLSQALATMAVQLRALMEGLEQQVNERTRALQEANRSLQRRAIQLQASTEVGRAITSIFDVDELLARTVELIRDQFGFYHAGIFLMDETGEWAVLREATGEAGAQMKAQGHRLAMGDTSMVGWTVLHRQPRIALYAEADAVRFSNPLLPHTRSEMTLPLMVGEHLLGVLNIQSTEVAAFEEDDVRILQSMANQVAVAIENARRVSDEALLLEATSPIYRASRRLAQATTVDEVADSIIASVRESGADGCTVVEFEFSPSGEPEALLYRGVWRRDREPQFQRGTRLPMTESPFPFHLVSTLWSEADVEQAMHLPQTTRRVFEETGVRAAANIPLRARERVVGQVVVLRATPGPFSDSALRLYEALSNQAAVALERSQLLEEAQRRADREVLARQMIDRIRRSMDIEQALQTTAEELSRAMGVDHVSIELSLEAPTHAGRNSPSDGHTSGNPLGEMP